MPLQNGLPSIIKSIQQGTINMVSGAGSATIAAVNTAKSFVSFNGSSVANGTVFLTNSTTVSGTYPTASSGTINYVVVEYV